jgi:hypothetical protein
MATTPNFNWVTPDNTGLVKNGALDIRTLGNAIDASMVDLKGGTTGQVLAKATNTDMDFSWVAQDDSNAIQNAIVDAKGDIIAASANDTPARLAVGTNGQVLTADSSTATGLKWAAAAGGGKVLQVISATTSTTTSNTTSTYADTTLTATITPTLSTSKILVLLSQNGLSKNNLDSQNSFKFKLVRGATDLAVFGAYVLWTNTATVAGGSSSFSYLDNPATTSATTYKTQFANMVNTSGVTVQGESSTSSIILLEIGA